MQIGKKIKQLRLKKGLTQEELGERTDLSKGYISQLERDLTSPSIETLFSLLEVLGSSPKEFFDDGSPAAKVVFGKDEHIMNTDEDRGYSVRWLVSESNEKEMEPVLLSLAPNGEFKEFEPSLSQTFIYVLEGRIVLQLGTERYEADEGDALYYEASHHHRLSNAGPGEARCLLVATESYL
ncbi:helix-turn-helix domain-containing protein [Bhargavaea beijingensis]|uniref:Transcriptional regulator, XRE family with cupin sensor n=1 Tax=Bhargavaea beijingensis TaxID=426756 RepID=A0A1G7BKA3_9BACL|nr:XRE family transcriptional regulator [Bhargavaea beijingensis]MCW1926790.1 XRE family transcriptional regulator [Bhargavaea beijingensis]RSK36962.1 XRE family transcriptional regulator [Bhargavaea beijingensis]SDE27528.1 transcriptional regulator, XRE family with cupin sensor [Bhargavaea beijingensis]